MTPRRITELDIERFTCGDCHILAREIHRLTEWPMASFGGSQPLTHAFVRIPSSPYAPRYLDIHGVQTSAQMYSRWSGYLTGKRISVFTEEEFSKHWMPFGWISSYGSYSHRRARELASFLVAVGSGSKSSCLNA